MDKEIKNASANNLIGPISRERIDANFVLALETLRTQAIYQEAIEVVQSPSHDRFHIDTTISRALELYVWCYNHGCQADWELIHASCCVHDLGRNDSNLHQEDSIGHSVNLARPILARAGYSEAETEAIANIVRSHDQPGLPARTLEGLILKEADFLAGFGAWGIYRTIAWGIESGRSTQKIISILREKMPQRIASLQLHPAQQLAWQQWPLVNLFLTQLETQTSYQERGSWQGKYIIVTGISGSGKDTQAALLKRWLLSERNTPVELIAQPSGLGKRVLEEWKLGLADAHISQAERAFLLAADRYAMTEHVIKSALGGGQTVISVRGFLDAMAYQGDTPSLMAQVFHLNQFTIRPDLVIYLNMEGSEKVALERIKARGSKRGDFETLNKLKDTSLRFRRAMDMIPHLPIVTISGLESVEKVFG